MVDTFPKILVVQIAGLGYEFLRARNALTLAGLDVGSAEGVFPGVTCTAQASFRTIQPPRSHGMVANGLFDQTYQKVRFWEQSAALVEGKRFWEEYRTRGGKVGMLFWQQSLGESADIVLSPAPIHKHHGGMIQDCYSQPWDLYARLCQTLGSKFNLMHYWGPMASAKVGRWIVQATCEVMRNPRFAPGLCLSYLPTLDYDLQRHGPDHPKAARALAELQSQLDMLVTTARSLGYHVLLYGDYVIAPVREAVLPNLALRDAGLFRVRSVRGMAYPDLYTSRAFAVVDHEVAHVYVRHPDDLDATQAVLRDLPGVELLLQPPEQARLGVDHANAGNFVLIAKQGAWFGYSWWREAHQAPDYATHVDIHNKPGFDPCELFFGFPPPLRTSTALTRVQGSHGRVGAGREIAWASSWRLPSPPRNVLALADAVATLLDTRETAH